MPELPEVETIRRALLKALPGRKITETNVRESRLRWPVDVEKVNRMVTDQVVKTVERRAKYLLIQLSNESSLVVHLGMSGQLLLLTDSRPLQKHDHVIFHFDDRSELRFRDPRRFGMVDVVSSAALTRYPRFAGLGFEPLDVHVTHDILFQKAKRSKKPIKNLLMDASFIVGVGNIYANEALFYAKIHPLTPSNKLGETDWQRLLEKLRDVLTQAIQEGGTTLNDFVNSNGETGYFQLSLAVYGRSGETCANCGKTIQRIVQAGRSSFFCATCQRLKS